MYKKNSGVYNADKTKKMSFFGKTMFSKCVYFCAIEKKNVSPLWYKKAAIILGFIGNQRKYKKDMKFL